MSRTITPEALRLELSSPQTRLLDVRRRVDFDADDRMIAGARWMDPEQVRTWRESLPTDRPVYIYCVRGASVSNSVLDALLERGVPARYLEGGITAWKQAGGETMDKPAA